MKSLWQQFQSWRKRRRQKRLDRWEQTRAKGKLRFVLRSSLIWGGTFLLIMCLTDLYYDRTLNFYKILGTVVYLSLVGPIISHVVWWENEGKFTSAKLDARMKSIEKLLADDGKT